MNKEKRLKSNVKARKRRTNRRRSPVKKNGSNLNGKIFILLSFLALLFVAGIGRLFYLQVVASDDLTRRALREMTKSENIYSERGLILDRNGSKLAVNITASNVFYERDTLSDLSEEEKNETISELSKTLANVTGEDSEELSEKLKGEGRVKLFNSLDRDKTLDLRRRNIPGLVLEDQDKRFYPFNNLASHVIGFINSEGIGQYGLESSFNKDMTGIAGKATSLKDRRNSKVPISDETIYAPKEGLTLVTTLDEQIQKIVEEEAEKTLEDSEAKGISIIVQDPKTGEILAMSNKPDYNLNTPTAPQTTEEKEVWDDLSTEEKQNIWYKNWRNFAVNDLYEPGSTFKSITTAAALEENTTHPDKHYYCTGYIRDIKGILVKCTSLPNAHGDLTLDKAFAESCNPTMVNVARELGKENFYKYILSFGFGQKTGIDLPGEQKGIIPGDENYSDVTQATLSYGHGIAVTPLQLINATSAIVNGGNLMVPKIVRELINSEGQVIKSFEPEIKRQVISEDTSNKMINLMASVVDNGSATRAKINGYEFGGKTGTAAKVAEEGGYVEDSYYSSFIGVAPLKNPKLVVLVIVDEPKGDFFGGTVAAPTASKITERVLTYWEVDRDKELTNELSQEKVKVPDVTNMLIEDAGRTLEGLGLRFSAGTSSLRDFSLVTSQIPEGGTEVEVGSVIDLYLNPNDSNSKTMPILSNKTKEEAESVLNELDVEYTIEGQGVVIDQAPKPGSVIKLDEEVVIILAKPLDELSGEETEENNEFTEDDNKDSEEENEEVSDSEELKDSVEKEEESTKSNNSEE